MGRRVKGLEFGRKKERKINLSLFREIIIWVVEIAITIVVAAVFTYFFGVRSTVVGPSMSPQLEDGNEVLIDRFFYKFISPKSGDIIAFLPNGNTNTHYYLKRVVAVPGDTVQIKDGRVYVNGEELVEEVEAARMEDAGLAENEITLAEDEYFVLGDNRNNSEDSRFANIGNIKESYIIGKAWFIIAPRDKLGLIQ
ncbi:MAG: signal peptidase I [Eubacterium sp.]|nr:signal peptidase I [Eubacterium sp.]